MAAVVAARMPGQRGTTGPMLMVGVVMLAAGGVLATDTWTGLAGVITACSGLVVACAGLLKALRELRRHRDQLAVIQGNTTTPEGKPVIQVAQEAVEHAQAAAVSAGEARDQLARHYQRVELTYKGMTDVQRALLGYLTTAAGGIPNPGARMPAFDEGTGE